MSIRQHVQLEIKNSPSITHKPCLLHDLYTSVYGCAILSRTYLSSIKRRKMLGYMSAKDVEKAVIRCLLRFFRGDNHETSHTSDTLIDGRINAQPLRIMTSCRRRPVN